MPVILTVGFCKVDVNPFGPVQPHVDAVPVLLRFNVLPAQTKLELALALTLAGLVLTVTFVDAETEPQELVAVTAYVPPWFTWLILMDGFCVDEEYPFGPVHDQAEMMPVTAAFRLSVFPTHKDEALGVAVALVGVTLTLMLTEELVFPQPLPAVTV